jgi:hypothetical protein
VCRNWHTRRRVFDIQGSEKKRYSIILLYNFIRLRGTKQLLSTRCMAMIQVAIRLIQFTVFLHIIMDNVDLLSKYFILALYFPQISDKGAGYRVGHGPTNCPLIGRYIWSPNMTVLPS